MKPRAQGGVTLVETLVYVVISAIVLTVLTLTLRDVNKGYVQGAQTVKMQQGAREALNIMARELRHAGLKHGVYPSGGGLADTIVTLAAFLPGDSSSLAIGDGGAGGRYDTLKVRMARLDADGRPLGVDTVTYRVTAAGMLQRRVNAGAFEDFCPNVDALQFRYGVLAHDSVFVNMRPPAAPWTRVGPPAFTHAFASTRLNLALASAASGYLRYDGLALNLNGGRNYFAEISATGDPAFFGNGGVLELRVLNSSGTVVHSEAFLPGRSLAKRRLILSPPTVSGGRLALFFRASGPAAARIGHLRFGQADLGDYAWLDAPAAVERKRVRALRIMLMARTTGPESFKPASSYVIGNATVTVSDDHLRRYYVEQVPVPNNGLF